MDEELLRRTAMTVIAEGRGQAEWQDMGGPEDGPIIVGGEWIALGRRLVLSWFRRSLELLIYPRDDKRDPYGYCDARPTVHLITDPAVLAAFRNRMVDVAPVFTDM